MDQCNSASDLGKQIFILDAILWLKSSWESLLPSTISKCFANCGFAVDDRINTKEITNDEEEVSFGAEGLMEDMSMVQFATFDDEVTTSDSLNDDWM